MKRIISFLVVFVLCFSTCFVLAEEPVIGLSSIIELLPSMSDEDITSLATAIIDQQIERGLEIVYPEPVATFEVMTRGSKGENVKQLQARLVELNFLSGSIDGSFGGGTESSVKSFQKAAGLEATGIVDEATWNALIADNAPISKEYQNLNFKSISRDPDAYAGMYYKFSGKVLQVLESEYGDYTSVDMRIATKGNYDDVVYVTYERPKGESRVLEDDRVNVTAQCVGLYSYSSVLGSTITLPRFEADTVTIK